MTIYKIHVQRDLDMNLFTMYGFDHKFKHQLLNTFNKNVSRNEYDFVKDVYVIHLTQLKKHEEDYLEVVCLMLNIKLEKTII